MSRISRRWRAKFAEAQAGAQAGEAAPAQTASDVVILDTVAGTKRPRSDEQPAAKVLHSGLFRERTVQQVSLIAEQIRGWGKDLPQASVLVETLEELADYVVDGYVLEKTGIGKEIKTLSTHPDQEIKERSSQLIFQWKRDLEMRKKVVGIFVEKASVQKKEARHLEEGLFNFACPLGYLEADGYKSYQRHFVRLSTHLRTHGKGCLAQRMREGEVSCLEVAFFPDEELLSVEQRERADQDRKLGLEEALATKGAQLDGIVTSEYTCPTCGSSKTMYKDVQTGWHSDHQDVTIIVSCMDCGERWKANDDHGTAS